MNTTKKKLFITGGHLTPAVAVIDEIRQRKLPWEIIFIGRTNAVEGKDNPAYEEQAVNKYGATFRPITAGRLQRRFSFYTLFSLLKIPVGFIQAFLYCFREKPDAVLSFGGYVALPVVVSAVIMRIPVLTHEQTSVPGLANRIIAKFAKKVCVTFESTLCAFPAGKGVYTGLPIRSELFEKITSSNGLDFPKDLPVIYITGGSTGAVTLNAMVFSLISVLTQHYTVVHQTGFASIDHAKKIKEMLSIEQQKHYIISDYYPIHTLSWILHHAEIIMGRSGANTVMEVAALGKMALFVPLPWSAGGEQEKNAQWLVKNGTSKIFHQEHDDPKRIPDIIADMILNRQRYLQAASRVSTLLPHHAAKRLISELAAIL